jgi:hypothetical protein
MSSEGFVDMDDERDYHSFVSSLMVDKETHFSMRSDAYESFEVRFHSIMSILVAG